MTFSTKSVINDVYTVYTIESLFIAIKSYWCCYAQLYCHKLLEHEVKSSKILLPISWNIKAKGLQETSVASAHVCKQPRPNPPCLKNFVKHEFFHRRKMLTLFTSNPRSYGNFVHVCFYVLLWLIPYSLSRRFTPPDCKYLQRAPPSSSSPSIILRTTPWRFTHPLFPP